MRYLPLLGAAFTAGFALVIGAVRAWDWWNDSIDNALRLGRG